MPLEQPGEAAVPALKGDGISARGLMLLGYQRTKQISRKARLAYEAGNAAPLAEEVARRGPAIFAGAVDEIHAEYLPVAAALRAEGSRPAHVIDIGCGQAINDAFLWADFAPSITLVDIEETDRKYHLWNDVGSGYAALSEAEGFLRANGVPADRLTAINPRLAPGRMAGLQGDLVTSLFSCGFHYPVEDYADLMCATLAAGGTVVLDLRLRYLRRAEGALARVMQAARTQQVLLDMPKSQRLMFRG